MVGWVQAGSVGVAHKLPITPLDGLPSFSRGTPGAKDTSASKRRGTSLSMYRDLPLGDVAIEEFERFALNRLRVLRGIEELRARGFRPDQLAEQIPSMVDKHMSAMDSEARAREDAISHFILRLVYCRTEDLRRWFLSQEVELFRARFRLLLPSEQRAFIKEHDLPLQPLTAAEFGQVETGLRSLTLAATGSTAATQALFHGPSPHEAFFKARFEQVPDLVAGRRCFLRGGWAFVSREHTASLVLAPFRAALSKALVLTARKWAGGVAQQEADRLTPVVEGLSQRYLGADYANPEARGVAGVAAADVAGLAQVSFPPCMYSMYQALRTTHHLKHDGRMQLGLFLKGVGLPMEEAIQFWRAEMGQSITAEKFDKEYLYNIRHNYGKEGNRKDYTPYTCAKVISTTPGVGQIHGCPFRTHSADSLRAMLGQLQVSQAATDEAVAKASAGHFQLACAAAWKGKHGACCESGINHPNQYFEESRKALTAPGEVAITPRPPSARGARPATTPGSVLPSPLGCLDGAGGSQTTPTPAKQARLA